MSGTIRLIEEEEFGGDDFAWIEPKLINTDDDFGPSLGEAGSKLTVVDFPDPASMLSLQLSEHLTELANTFRNNVAFLKVDIDSCPATVISERIYVLPTVKFYVNMIPIDKVHGYHPEKIEEKINKYCEIEEPVLDPGYRNLLRFIHQSNSFCLNESYDFELSRCLTDEPGYLKSSEHEQLILVINFHEPMKLHSIMIKAPPTTGPKTIKIYVNHQCTLNFYNAKVRKHDQMIRLTPNDLEGGILLLEDRERFDNARCLQVFVVDNQNGEAVTVIDEFAVFGSPFSSEMLEKCREQWVREMDQ